MTGWPPSEPIALPTAPATFIKSLSCRSRTDLAVAANALDNPTDPARFGCAVAPWTAGEQVPTIETLNWSSTSVIGFANVKDPSAEPANNRATACGHGSWVTMSDPESPGPENGFPGILLTTTI